MDNRPIGVFDSGMGGLSVWRVMRRDLPRESMIYYGDGANCPYGTKASAEVFGYIVEGVEELLERGAKMIVLACNTATMIAIEELRKVYTDTPFIGIEPAVKPAAESTHSGVVGVLATKASLGSEWFADLVARYDDKARIITGEGEGFVQLVEQDKENTPEALEAVRAAMTPMIDAGADKIVLGCTHYPLLMPQMIKVIGDRKIELIDPAPAITRRVEWLLDTRGMRAGKDGKVTEEFLTAAGEEYRARLIAKSGLCLESI